jgi:hypothetical protein
MLTTPPNAPLAADSASRQRSSWCVVARTIHAARGLGARGLAERCYFRVFCVQGAPQWEQRVSATVSWPQLVWWIRAGGPAPSVVQRSPHALMGEGCRTAASPCRSGRSRTARAARRSDAGRRCRSASVSTPGTCSSSRPRRALPGTRPGSTTCGPGDRGDGGGARPPLPERRRRGPHRPRRFGRAPFRGWRWPAAGLWQGEVRVVRVPVQAHAGAVRDGVHDRLLPDAVALLERGEVCRQDAESSE